MLVPMNVPNTRAYGTDILETGSTQPVPTRSRRNTFGGNLVKLDDHDIADRIRDPVLAGTAIGSS